MENDFTVNGISKRYNLVSPKGVIAYQSRLSIALRKALAKTANIENINTLWVIK